MDKLRYDNARQLTLEQQYELACDIWAGQCATAVADESVVSTADQKRLQVDIGRGERAVAELALSYTGLAKAMAGRQAQHMRLSTGDHYNDLVQIGMVVLVEAAKDYTPYRGNKLAALAYPRMLNAMFMYAAGNSYEMKLPPRFFRETFAEPDPAGQAKSVPEEHAESSATLATSFRRLRHTVSLDELGPHSQTLAERTAAIFGWDSEDPAVWVEESDTRLQLERIIQELYKNKKLTESDMTLIAMRYYQERPFEDIAKQLGKKSSSVRMQHQLLLRKIRRHSGIWAL